MTERLLQQQVLTAAKKRGIFAVKTEAVGRRGFPDVTLIAGGRVVFVELKHPNGRGKLSALQSMMIEDMRAHGAEVHVMDSLSDCLTLLDSML
jgi:hypothetical protein